MQRRRLEEARDLLNIAEATKDATSKISLLSRAVDIFDECIEDEPSSEEFTLIQNIKKTFARSLPSQIVKMRMDDIKTTEFFFLVYILNFAYEVAVLCNENPNYEKEIESLAEKFRPDLI